MAKTRNSAKSKKKPTTKKKGGAKPRSRARKPAAKDDEGSSLPDSSGTDGPGGIDVVDLSSGGADPVRTGPGPVPDRADHGLRVVVNAQLAHLVVPIDRLTYDPKNARKHDDDNTEATKHSLEQFGQQKCIVVDDRGVVVAGNGTVKAAKLLGWTGIAAVLYDGAGPQDGYAIADNRTAEMAKWDFRRLSTSLKDLKERNFDLNTLGWRDYELDPLINARWTPPPANPNALGAGRKPEKITVTADQWEVIQKGLGMIRKELDQLDMSDGRGLELICADFIAGAPQESEDDAEAEDTN